MVYAGVADVRFLDGVFAYQNADGTLLAARDIEAFWRDGNTSVCTMVAGLSGATFAPRLQRHF